MAPQIEDNTAAEQLAIEVRNYFGESADNDEVLIEFRAVVNGRIARVTVAGAEALDLLAETCKVAADTYRAGTAGARFDRIGPGRRK